MAKIPISKSETLGWWSKIIAGLLLGYALAIGSSGLLHMLLAGGPPSGNAQLIMWLVIPIWLSVLGVSVAFDRARDVWLLLIMLNGLVYGALYL